MVWVVAILLLFTIKLLCTAYSIEIEQINGKEIEVVGCIFLIHSVEQTNKQNI